MILASIWNGPVGELLLGKLVDNQLAVVGRVAARGKPRDHIVAAARHHREHEKELGLRLPGQPHDDAIRLQGKTRAAQAARVLTGGSCSRARSASGLTRRSLARRRPDQAKPTSSSCVSIGRPNRRPSVRGGGAASTAPRWQHSPEGKATSHAKGSHRKLGGSRV